MGRRYDLYLKDILEAIERIQEYTEDYDKQSLETDRKTLDATLRNLETIGEAAGSLPQTLKDEYDEIEWRKVKDFRNVVVHQSWEIDTDIVWDILVNKLPDLKENVREILDEKHFSH
jgi:uncharacterized protein with HEPN domain